MNKLNKFFALVIVLILFSACIVKKNTPNKGNDTVIIDDNSTNTDIPKPKPVPVIKDTVKPVKPDTVIVVEPVLELKNEYNIAIILPLQSDSINSSWGNHYKSDLEDFVIPTVSQEALNFLEGAILALEEQNVNSRLNIKVYDNEYSYAKTQQILSRLPAENIDFIFGPINKQNIQLVSNFAKKNNIIMVSPFSPSKMASSNYSKYIMPAPSLDIHFYTMAKFIIENKNKSHIKILYPNTLGGQNHAYSMQSMLASMNDTLPYEKRLKYALVEVEEKTNDRKNFKISDYLDTDVNNIVIVVSFNEGFVHNMLTNLNLTLNKFDVTVFGMPNWKESKTLRLDYFNNLNVHYTDAEWIDENDFKTSTFISNFKNKHQANPSFNAFLGYDLFSFFTTLIDKYGLSLTEKIHLEKYQGLLNLYHFQPLFLDMESSDNATNRIENTHLHVISYKNFMLNLEQ